MKVEVPVWQIEKERFGLETNEKATPQEKLKIPVQFGTPGGDLVLVDFEGGKQVRSDSALEVLVVRPDGRLLARNSFTDKADKDRLEQLAAYQKRRIEASKP